MLKKITACITAIVMSVSCMSFMVYANSNDFKTFYSELEKAKFEKSSFNYTQDTLYGNMIDFKNGVIGGKIADFDNDTKNELLVFRIEKGGEKLETPDIYDRNKSTGTVIAEMYEEKNGEVVLADSFSTSEFLNSDAGEYEFFIKETNGKKYICVENMSYSTCFADGIIFEVQICSYNGTNFENKLSFNGGGSAFEFDTYYTDEMNKFRELGFDKSVNEMIDGYTIINFAKYEDNVEKIVEFLTTSNSTSLGEIYGYSNLEETVVAHGIVNVIMNNYTNIDNTSSALKNITVILNGKELSFEQPPYIENGTTMVPMRAIFEALGANISFDADSKTITSTKDGKTVSIILGYNIATVNSKNIKLSVSPKSVNGYSMVPLRFVSEAFGAKVEYNGIDKIITITL